MTRSLVLGVFLQFHQVMFCVDQGRQFGGVLDEDGAVFLHLLHQRGCFAACEVPSFNGFFLDNVCLDAQLNGFKR